MKTIDRTMGFESGLYDDVLVSVQSLEKTKVASGEVIVQNLLKTSKVKASLLYISPGGSIKKHTHVNDSEIYIYPVEEKIDGCHKGESHSLVNHSKEPMFVLSLKYGGKVNGSMDVIFCEEQYESIAATLKSGEAKQLVIYENADIQVCMFVLFPGASFIKPEVEDAGWLFFLEDFRTEYWGEIYNIVNRSDEPLYLVGLKYKK